MEKFLTDVGTAGKYDFKRPVPSKPVAPVTKYSDVMAALASPSLASTVPHNASIVLPGKGYLASYNDASVNAADKKLIAEAFVPSSVVLKKQVDFLERTTAMLLKEKSYTLVGDNKLSVNVVRDIINLLPAYFISEYVVSDEACSDGGHNPLRISLICSSSDFLSRHLKTPTEALWTRRSISSSRRFTSSSSSTSPNRPLKSRRKATSSTIARNSKTLLRVILEELPQNRCSRRTNNLALRSDELTICWVS